MSQQTEGPAHPDQSVTDEQLPDGENVAERDWFPAYMEEQAQLMLHFYLPSFAVITTLLFFMPCFSYGTSMTLTALPIMLTKAATQFHRWVAYHKLHGGDLSSPVDRASYCCRRFAAPAPVYLMTSTIDLLASSASSDEGQASSFEPVVEQIEPQWAPLMGEMVTLQHWAIIIRGITYELLRNKATSEIEVRKTTLGDGIHVDAAGIPLKPMSRLIMGTTFLSDLDIEEELDANRKSRYISLKVV